ncbi:MAG: response regulator [Desulfobacteraceae bacterium]|nr:response regulator [Desulfobacteraceae bacterium]
MGRKRILVVDDELALRESLAGWLERDGYEVEMAAGSKEALKRLKDSRFDILIVDVKMKEISGMEILKQVKANHPNATVIMMTAYGSIDTAIKAMKNNAYDYLLKPFDPIDLSLMIKKIFQEKENASKHRLPEEGVKDQTSNKRRIVQSKSVPVIFDNFPNGNQMPYTVSLTPKKSTDLEKKNLKIMLVDDEKRFILPLKKRLSRRGYDIITANNGMDALRKLKQTSVQVVFLDVMMPFMDGMETLIEIKNHYPNLEVIMLTGKASLEDAVKCLKYGAADYLMKPTDIEEIIQKAEDAFKKEIC